MSNKTFEEATRELVERVENGQFPSESEMRDLLVLGVTEAEDYLPALIDEVAYHVGHGDDRHDMIDGIALRLDNFVPISGTLLAAILIHHLATLQNAGVDVGLQQTANVG